MTTDAITTAEQKFGTFLGVYLPSILSIFGVIMYLRLGWILGIGGIPVTITIITLGSLITLITALSISSITTNMPILGGGVYYMLSRTFGIELGSATCIPLYLSQALSISFYTAGFAESIYPFFPYISFTAIKLIALCFVTILALISTKFALRTQFFILLVIILSLISLFLGKSTAISFPSDMSVPGSFSFWMLFAIFFPAVTGIENGVSLSGELKKPERALPYGTICAVMTGFILYSAIALFLATHATKQQLVHIPHLVQEIAFNKQLILAGIWGATLSSAIAGMLAAPRTLQALAQDSVLPKWLAKTGSKGSVPIVASLLTFLIAFLGLTFGTIEQIAPILTMFFLISYGMLNMATGLEDLFGNPSWRPTFKTHWPIALAGSFLCFLAMIMINAGATLISFFFVLGIFLLMKKRAVTSNWEDIRQSVLLFLSRFAIYHLAKTHLGPKCWRPNLLVFLGDPFLRSHLIGLTQAITHEKGFLIMASIISEKENSESYQEKMERFFENNHVHALVKILESDSIPIGMKTLIQSHGIGSLSPNTIVLGATHNETMFPLFAEVIFEAQKMHKNVIIIRENERLSSEKKSHCCIDVWWGGVNRNNSELMLVLAFMLQTSKNWKNASISLKTIVTDESHYKPMIGKLNEVSNKGRMRIRPEVVIAKEKEDVFRDTMRRQSQDSDLVFMGLKSPDLSKGIEDYVKYYKKLLQQTEEFPPLALVLASEQIDFKKILL